MKNFGKHLIIKMYVNEKKRKILENFDDMNSIFSKYVLPKVNVISVDYHDFGPNMGITASWLLKESHMSIHTWPEDYFIMIDIFTCGTINPAIFIEDLQKAFGSIKMETKLEDISL